jgi:hyperosmotically inducible periplasmic protein
MNATSHNSKGLFLSVILTLLIALGMGDFAFAASRNNTQQAPHDPAAYQAWLTKEVRHELVMLPWLSVFDNLEYKVEGTKVTLLGQVVRPSTKSDAENSVKRLEGVSSVDDQIEVLPLSPNDDHIRRAEYGAIYGFSDLYRYAQGALPSIHIIVKNGNVTLEGVVDNEGDKNMVNIRANTVPGVFSVKNNLRVEGAK